MSGERTDLKVAWSGTVPRWESAKMDLLSPRPKQPLDVIALNERWLAVTLHWSGDGSTPHFSDADECPGCRHKWPTRWKAFLGVWQPGVSRRGLLELTADAVRQSFELRDPATNLRGRMMHCERVGTARNSPVRVTVGSLRDVSKAPPFDVVPFLMRLWFGPAWKEVDEVVSFTEDRLPNGGGS